MVEYTLRSELGAGPWFILDVMPKGRRKSDGWAALLIDMDADEYCAGGGRHRRVQSRWLDLGRHPNRGQAWDVADAQLATRH